METPPLPISRFCTLIQMRERHKCNSWIINLPHRQICPICRSTAHMGHTVRFRVSTMNGIPTCANGCSIGALVRQGRPFFHVPYSVAGDAGTYVKQHRYHCDPFRSGRRMMRVAPCRHCTSTPIRARAVLALLLVTLTAPKHQVGSANGSP
jgi:hypothetical protein